MQLSHPHSIEHLICTLINQCPNMATLRHLHAQSLKHPSHAHFLLSKILAFAALSRSGNTAYALRLLSTIPHPNTFTYNSLIRGLSQQPNPTKRPFTLYRTMLATRYAIPNSYTLAFLLKAMSSIAASPEGRQVHTHAYRSGFISSPFVETGLLTFYAKCEDIGSARTMFDGIPDKNLFAWSAMISCYARVGMANEAVGIFRGMQEAGVCPDEVTMVSVVSACAKAGALELGEWVHAFVDRKGIAVDLELSTALIDMYAKCGLIGRARKVFDEMGVRDDKAWSSMIVGLAIHGCVKECLELFARMMESKVKPNHVTFIGVLSACAHSGLVDDGRRFWTTMNELGIEPRMEHYGCMVDLLCRAGLVDEAYSFVKDMPISPNSVIWRTLLVGCKNSKDIAKGEVVAERLLELEPLNPENYVVLSSLYASRAQWEKMSYTRKKMKDIGVKVVPGCSSIEVDGYVHGFVLGNDSHPNINEIRGVLKDIAERVRHYGHEPRTSVVLHNVGEEEKESALCEHSERLAIAFGLWKTKAPVVIRVVKNLRVCGDCHDVTKIISVVYDREIIVRDRVRFHRFVRGTCSCDDFW